MLEKVREDLANLTDAERASAQVLLIEHLAFLIDTEPAVAAIKELRSALASVLGEPEPTATDAVDEVQKRRERRQHAVSEGRARP